jgi:hypothetical protein
MIYREVRVNAVIIIGTNLAKNPLPPSIVYIFAIVCGEKIF